MKTHKLWRIEEHRDGKLSYTQVVRCADVYSLLMCLRPQFSQDKYWIIKLEKGKSTYEQNI